jgi:phage terminase large subunit
VQAAIDPTAVIGKLSPQYRLGAKEASRDSGRVIVPSPDIINEVYIPYLKNTARTQILFGGSSSGKSVFLAQRDVLDLMEGHRNFLVCRHVGRTLRRSVFAEIKKVITDWEINNLFHILESEMVVTHKRNGKQILFAGLDDTEKLKSITPADGVITDVRVEEATETNPDSIKQLYKRQRGGDPAVPKRLTLSFNPILLSHHIYQTYFAPIGWTENQTSYQSPDGRLSILKTWYIHNRFLTDDDIYDLENEQDKYYRDVYTFGTWGILGDVIFKNWRVEYLSGMVSKFTNHRHGLDFGFSNDPAAVPVTHYDSKNGRIFIYNELYELGLTNDILASELRAMIGRDYVTGDSSEPKSIRELQNYGINVLPAEKGKDSVLHGVQWLQQQEIIIDEKCVNTINEFQQYQWKKDKDGNAMRQPVDRNNHIIDALRYAYERDMAFAAELEVF